MTRKNNGNRQTRLPTHANTFHGLHHWHTKMFEKLGWMVLAKAKGYDYKIAAYLKSIEHLVASIEHVISEYHDEDKIHDLRVLHMNAIELLHFATSTLL
jgi:hypothetical protein